MPQQTGFPEESVTYDHLRIAKAGMGQAFEKESYHVAAMVWNGIASNLLFGDRMRLA